MRSMKILLRLMGAVALSTVAASSVVACGNAKASQLDGKYAVLLGLYTNETTSKIEQKLSQDETEGKEKEEININNKAEITGINFKDKLLVAYFGEAVTKFKAKNDDAAKFLADLGFKSGDDKYYSAANVAAINALKAKITSVEAGKIEVNNDKTDFNVEAGTCQISIMNKDGADAKVIKDYTISTLKKDKLGVPIEVGKLVTIENLDLSSEKGFKINGPVLKVLVWKSEKVKEQKKYQSLITLFGKDSLTWSENNTGIPEINKYRAAKIYVTINFKDVKVIQNLDLGQPTA